MFFFVGCETTNENVEPQPVVAEKTGSFKEAIFAKEMSVFDAKPAIQEDPAEEPKVAVKKVIVEDAAAPAKDWSAAPQSSASVSPFEAMKAKEVTPKVEVKAVPETVVSLVINFYGADGHEGVSVAEFQKGDERVADQTPLNFIRMHNPNDHTLQAFGASDIKLNGLMTQGRFTTSKGSWKDDPILNGYLFTRTEMTSDMAPVLQLSNLGDIPGGALVTLTLWGVADTDDADTVFELFYDGASLGQKMTDYDGELAATRVPFTFEKIAGVYDLEMKWAKSSGDQGGFNGLVFVTTTPSM